MMVKRFSYSTALILDRAEAQGSTGTFPLITGDPIEDRQMQFLLIEHKE